jgi:AraC-like DNA-binding protein
MLDVIAETTFPPGVRRRVDDRDGRIDNWISWDDSAAVCLRRSYARPFVFEARARRLCVVRLLEAGPASAVEVADAGSWRAEAGPATLVLPPGAALRGLLDGECAAVALMISPREHGRAGADAGTLGSMPAAGIGAPDPLLDTVLESVGDRCRRGSAVALAWVRAAARMVSIELGTPEAAPEEGRSHLQAWRLRRIDRLIDERLGDRLALSDLAGASGLSLYHFARAFRASTGMTPMAYLQLRRCERAREMLLGGTAGLAEVAAACGFRNQSHFTRVFRRLEGETPGRWRALRGDGPAGAGA